MEQRVDLSADQKFDELERAHPQGMSVQQIVDACAASGERITEATFRKYVQLGLLPRSVRVGKGRSRGSQGLYPASTVRQVQLIRALMAQGFTIEEIKGRVLFVRGDLDALAKLVERVFVQLEQSDMGADTLARRELDRRLDQRRLSIQARMQRAAV